MATEDLSADDLSRDSSHRDRESPHEGNHSNKRRKYSHDIPKRDVVSGSLLYQLYSDVPEFNLTSKTGSDPEQSTNRDGTVTASEEWQTVDKNGRPLKKTKKIPKPKSSNYPSISFSSESRLQSQIKISDLQGLVLYIMADGQSPQWVSVRHRPEIRKVVVLMVPGLEKDMFITKNKSENAKRKDVLQSSRAHDQNVSPDEYYPVRLSMERLPSQLSKFAEMFEHLWPVKTPGEEKFNKMHSPLQAMLSAPLSKSQAEKSSKAKKGVTPAQESQWWQNKRTRITNYISLPERLLENDYPLHPAMYTEQSDKIELLESRKKAGWTSNNGWVDTLIDSFEDGSVPEPEIQQGSVTAGREVIAMDCEMCLTGPSELALTRISLVGWDGTVILDELIKPEKPITDYVTMYSGITEAMLRSVSTSLQDIQQRLLEILHPKTILVGHSLDSDLRALQMTHPYIVDTALLYPHPRGPPLKSSLKWLAQKYLSREIQKGHGTTGLGAGHNSIEDARTCLDLVKQKCDKGPEWGTSEATQENLFKRLARSGVRYKNQGSTVVGGEATGKTSAAVDWGDPKKGAGGAANVTIGCQSDEEVMRGVIRAVKGDPDGADIRGGGVDFVWGRLRELESLKGWWNNNKQLHTEAAEISTLPIRDHETSSKEELEKNAEEVKEANDGASSSIGREAVSAEATSSNITPSEDQIEECTAALTDRLNTIYESLPPCTAFIIYSGSGDPREMSRLQNMQQTFKREFKVKKWDQLSVKWTDVEEQALKKATRQARNGIGFVCVK